MTRILIVEDNEMNRDMLSRRLKRKGYDIEVAVDGQQGVDMATELMPDIVLMDMSLPIMDGWKATKTLRNNPATAALKIIALTAHAMEGDRQKAMKAGCDDYDTKPIDLKRLLGKIEALL
ncbi:MAG: response regulator [Xanthomonadales bacterium]|nr:response regulator [Xanthomonadales bacterium]